MVVRRARKASGNGWQYFEILLLHQGLVYRIRLDDLREESRQGSGFIRYPLSPST
jgi:hypothetical protein